MSMTEVATSVAEAKDYKKGCHLPMLLALYGTGIVIKTLVA